MENEKEEKKRIHACQRQRAGRQVFHHSHHTFYFFFWSFLIFILFFLVFFLIDFCSPAWGQLGHWSRR